MITEEKWNEYGKMADQDFIRGDVFLVRTRERMIADNIPKKIADAFAIGYLSVMAEYGMTPSDLYALLTKENHG